MDARLAMMKRAIVRHRTGGALVRVTSQVYGSVQDNSTDRLVRYVHAIYPILCDYLPN